MRRHWHAAAALLMLITFSLFAIYRRTDPNLSFAAHSRSPMPASAKLVHSGGQYAGPDASYGFVFDVSDKAIQEQLIGEWGLGAQPATESGFFKFAKYPWWPADDAFVKMDECFGRSDDRSEEYWHVWHDRPNGKLYVEHGWW